RGGYKITGGLQNRHIAMWQSHGYYYEQKLLRWEWQRARFFGTVEDLYTQSYVLPFLVPMLENAGAVVMLPRERDIQVNEVIVDNDDPSTGYSEPSGLWKDSDSSGFYREKDIYLSGENPFRSGSARESVITGSGRKSFVVFRPHIPERGEYAVYVAYQSHPSSTKSALYTIHHKGGATKVIVNQSMGGGTWIYLGTFLFEKGRNDDGFVELSGILSEKGDVLSADAVRLGGGMGNIAREPSKNGESEKRPGSLNSASSKRINPDIKSPEFKVDLQTSGYPRFTEGARYWLQWAGFSDTIYSPDENSSDYNDDYMSRGRWVNVLSGGSAKNPKERGYGIPLDLAFAFHTDAGITPNDSVIGTLAIYTRYSEDEDLYPTGEPRFNNRYLSDIVQTQIVDDIRALYEPLWQRRGIWDRSYFESRVPKVPSMLLELLSHQNFADMRYGLDPSFRFTVSRAIYKGILKYLSLSSGMDYVVQPLPVNSFSATFEKKEVRLEWAPSQDSLEETATPDGYMVYTRINGDGFDNGRFVSQPEILMQVESGKIYSFKVTAVNKGGESFPSEILSVYKAPQERHTVLIVNGFDRLSAPKSFASSDTSYAGFLDFIDSGVPYLYDISYVGSQYEFRRSVEWSDDDSPGFGASYADYETKVIAGNSFDYPYIHGKAFAKAGLSFVSCSRDAVTSSRVRMNDYPVVDIIMGKQQSTVTGREGNRIRYRVFPSGFMHYIRDYAAKGGKIVVSGANIGTDVWDSPGIDNESKDFVNQVLKYTFRSNNASRTGKFKGAPNPWDFKGSFTFSNTLNPKIYCVESPDAIEPYGEGSHTIFRYSDNNLSAGIAYKGSHSVVALGFPIETIESEEKINEFISYLIKFFEL
ncbi:MAG: xanthan lyase, partial [Bacteroidales bacterium]|nr:xanthan lyase [Bacteroidales bacterium]